MEIFEELASVTSFTETFKLNRSYAIRHDQQNKEKPAMKTHGTNQPTNNSKRQSQESLSVTQQITSPRFNFPRFIFPRFNFPRFN